MKHDPLIQTLRETAWRRPLTTAEQIQLDAWLAAHPADRAEWELDAALNAALNRIPEQPVATNFTARVLAAIEQEDLTAAETRKNSSRLGWLRSLGWVPRAAAVATLLLVSGLTWRHFDNHRQAQAMERFVAATEATPLPPPEAFQEFETILHIMPSGAADVSLLTLMQ
jgi:anti-sigma factor RsiW